MPTPSATANMVVIEGFTGSSISQGAQSGPSLPSGPILPPPYVDQGTQAGQFPILGLSDVGPSRQWSYLAPGRQGGQLLIPAMTPPNAPAILAAIGYAPGGALDMWVEDQQRRSQYPLVRVSAYFYDGSVPWPFEVTLFYRREAGIIDYVWAF